MDEVFLHAVGVTISADAGVAVSGASELWIKFKRPDGTGGKWSGSANGSNVEYVTTWPDINTEGVWQYQSYVVGLSGLTEHGAIEYFRALKPLH